MTWQRQLMLHALSLVNMNATRMPFVEMAAKLANVFGVSIDFLIGEGQHATYDKEAVKCLEDIENLDGDTKNAFSVLLIRS